MCLLKHYRTITIERGTPSETKVVIEDGGNIQIFIPAVYENYPVLLLEPQPDGDWNGLLAIFDPAHRDDPIAHVRFGQGGVHTYINVDAEATETPENSDLTLTGYNFVGKDVEEPYVP